LSLILTIDDYQPIQALLKSLSLSLRPQYFSPKKKVTPFSPVWTIYSKLNKNRVIPAEWAMNPNWARKGQIPRPLTIARAESVFERVSYKALIRRYRGLLPVNGVTVRSLNKNINGMYMLVKHWL